MRRKQMTTKRKRNRSTRLSFEEVCESLGLDHELIDSVQWEDQYDVPLITITVVSKHPKSIGGWPNLSRRAGEV